MMPPPRLPVRSPRAREVARRFGIGAHRPAPPRPPFADVRSILPPPGAITLVTGASGSGKSSLLRAACCATDARWMDLDDVKPRDVPLVDCFDERPLDETLALLARVGLAEVWTYIRTPSELSDGQRWRLKLALALNRASSDARLRTILCADEFCAVLDRVSAMIVARTLRRAVRAPLSAIVATSHDDLAKALRPDLIVTCDFEMGLTLRRGAGSSADDEACFKRSASTARTAPGSRTAPPA